MRLNLGAGNCPLDGYENLDIKNGCEVSNLVQYADNTLDEIRASHILEHFSHTQVFAILQGWVKKLKAGGVLRVAVPDFAKIAQGYLNRENLNIQGYLMGGHTDANDYHKAIFDRTGLEKAFEALGLGDIKEWKSETDDCASLPISLNLQGTKKSATESAPMPAAESVNAILDYVKDKAKNIYSQNGEDGIFAAIFEKIGTKNKWCLEVGASDGIMFSNTRALVERGWNAILIEKDAAVFERLQENCKNFKNVQCLNIEIAASGENSLDAILKKCGAPTDIDLVCIDIDGQDWHIWNQMLDYQPRVMCIEYEPYAMNPEFVPAIGQGGQAGIEAIKKLAASKLYHGQIITDYNVIAISNCAMQGDTKPDTAGTHAIKAVMSMPRLCFADNIFSAISAFVPLNIPLERGIGVFWGQVLTRMMQRHLDDGTEFIFTLDYDTYFTQDQVKRLIKLMREHPECDAICPLQIKREEDSPLFQAKNADGTQADRYEIDMTKDILPISSGHFGLTLFRTASLKKLKRPWFVGVPDINGGWDDGRKDEDIYFWENFANSGLKLGIAHKVGIGHLQMTTTFPSHAKDGYRPQHWYINDVILKGIPQWCKGI